MIGWISWRFLSLSAPLVSFIFGLTLLNSQNRQLTFGRKWTVARRMKFFCSSRTDTIANGCLLSLLSLCFWHPRHASVMLLLLLLLRGSIKELQYFPFANGQRHAL
uniref:Putative secreted protein n=1 Tax=Anopheles darlingi TaxID=43151 RepID=A0A2M4D6V2_ANODA